MPIEIPFAKASGAGNDFVIIDNHTGWLQCEGAGLARALCARHTGIGGDGLLLLEPSNEADFRMMYYNSDGSFGGMCGNGGRCIARFASMAGLAGRRMRFEALGHIYEAEILDQGVRLKMKDPADYRPGLSVSTENGIISVSFVNTGSPHAVTYVDDIAGLDVQKTGRSLRYHGAFSPEGVNANFVHILSENSIELRTYERGVEAETLACGTGSIASAVVSVVEKNLAFPVHVRVRSGEELVVDGKRRGRVCSDIYLQGSADILFAGTVLYDCRRSQIEAYVRL